MVFILRLAIYFIVGIVQTSLQVVTVRYIAKEKALGAALITFINGLLQLFVLVSILTNLQSSVISIIVYTLGGAIGTYAGIILRLEKKIAEV